MSSTLALNHFAGADRSLTNLYTVDSTQRNAVLRLATTLNEYLRLMFSLHQTVSYVQSRNGIYERVQLRGQPTLEDVQGPLCTVPYVMPLVPLADIPITMEVRHTPEYPVRGLRWVERVEQGKKLPLWFTQVTNSTDLDGGWGPQR